MKKEVKIIIIIFIMLILITFIMHLFKSYHKVKYVINKSINVTEEYVKNKKNDYYLLRVKIKDKDFIFSYKNTFNKKKKILKDIKILDKDKLLCAYPKLIDDTYLDIECIVNDKLYSYESIKDKYDLKDLINSNSKFNKDKYKDDNNNKKSYKDIEVFSNNFYDKENIMVYNYKDLIKINKENATSINFSSFDIYKNNLGALINNYYLIPKYNKKKEIDTYYIIDILKEKKLELDFKKYKLSTNTYINGVVDDKLYLFDKSNINQYEINYKNKKITRIGNNKNAKYYNGSWINYNPYNYVKNEEKFSIDVDLDVDYKEIYESFDCFYFYNSKNEFYKVYKNNLDLVIYLFKFDSFKEVKVINNKIYFISNNTLYRYDQYGVKSILKRNEFKYNYNNIYSAYFE